MNEQTINDFILLLKKKQQLENDGYQQSETLKTKNNLFFQRYKKAEFKRLLKQFPIFDIIPQNQRNVLNDFQFIKSSYNEGDKRIYIKKNNDQNQYEISIDGQNYYGNFKGYVSYCASNIVLQQNTKYIFRIQLKSDNYNDLIFGLMKEKNFNIQQGKSDLMYACFKSKNNKLQLQSSYLTYNYLRGQDMELEQGGIVELRIWQSGKLFQILDYPNYDCKATLQNETLTQLQKMNDLKLFIEVCTSQERHIITDALIVEEFDD
ncbi:hypothetical protein ABPG74_007909 [Tetrahymena malaccensis]